MKTQKIIWTIFIFSFIFLTDCSDQREGRQSFNPHDQALTLQKELNLTDEQTAGIETIYTRHLEKMREAREQSRGDREQMRTMMRAMRDSLNTEIESQLSEEQVTRYREYLESRQERGPRGDRRPE